MAEILAAVDIGTSGVKAMLFDACGSPLGSGYQEVFCTYPRVNWVEQDPVMLLDAAFNTLGEAVRQSNVSPSEVAALSFSTQRSCAIFIDEHDVPIVMLSWQDNRATDEVRIIKQTVDEAEYYRVTGTPPCETWILPKWLWFRKNEPEQFSKTSRVLQLHDYIFREFGADDYITDETSCAFFGFWDTFKRKWNEDYLDLFNIDRRMLPAPTLSGVAAGMLSEKAAGRIGLLPGTPLITGVGDDNSACAGTGILREGQISSIIGTGGGLKAFSSTPVYDPAGSCFVTNSVVSPGWQIEGLTNAAASSFRWFRDEIAALEKEQATSRGEDPYELLSAMAESVPPGARGLLLLPYFAAAGTPRLNPNARGTLIGLSLLHDRACIARAFMEGIAMENKDILCSFQDMGMLAQCIRATSGAAKSSVWTQIQADVYNMPVERLIVTDSALLGAAMSAAVGAGMYPDFLAASDAMVQIRDRVEPIPENAERYDALFALYCKAYEAMSSFGVFDGISSLQDL